MSSKNEREYSFSERLEWMEQQRRLLDAAFYPHLCYQGRWVYLGGSSAGTAHLQRREHLDVVATVVLRSGPESLTIDEKIDSQLRQTIFLETWSKKEENAPGWIVPGVSHADALLWAFPTKRPPGLRVFVFRMDALRNWFYQHLKDGWFTEHHIPNREGSRRWTTVGNSVPLKYLPPEMFIVNARQIEEQLGLFGWDETDALEAEPEDAEGLRGWRE